MHPNRIAPLACLVLIVACTSAPAGHNANGSAAPPAPATASAPAAQSVRFDGVVTAIADSRITVAGSDGASTSFIIAPDAWIVKGRPIQAREIHAGDFVATANVNNPDGTGTSTELRVFPPSMHLGEGSYPMQQENTTMTNATVSQVTNVGNGRQLTVAYGASQASGTPAGTRIITLPASVQVMQWYRAALADVRVGSRVRGRGDSRNGAMVADFVFAADPPIAVPARPH